MGSLAVSGRFWAFLREALGGSRRNFTEGSIPGAIALLALPMVLEMSMESLFGLVDAYFVNRVGKEAVATVILTESVLILIFGVAIGLSISTTALVARRFGEGNRDSAARTAVQAIFLGAVISVATALVGVPLAPAILHTMGASPSIVEHGSIYTSTILGSSITIFLLFLLNGVFRGAGDASMSLRSLILANGINIALNPCLILGLGPFPKLGLLGSAVATLIGRGTGVGYQLFVLLTGRGRLRIGREHLQLDPPLMWRLVRISLTGILQVQISTASWLGMVRIMATFGSAALAGYGLAVRTIVVAILPAYGMSNAAATLVGQNLGAGKPDRAEKSVWITGFFNMGFLTVVAAVFVFAADRVIGFYRPDPEMIPYGVACLRTVALVYPFFAWGMVCVQAFNGAGDTVTPTIVNFFCYWCWQIPLAYLLAIHFAMGPQGVFTAIAIAQCTLATVGLILFRGGRWKRKKV